MKHYEILKLVSGANPEKVQHKVRKALEKMNDELDWVTQPVVYRSCMGEGAELDVMAVVDIGDEEKLSLFLTYPTFTKMMDDVGEQVKRRFTFDHY